MIAKLDDAVSFARMRESHGSTKRSGWRKLNILMPVLNFGAEETGVGRYTYEMACNFAKAGHNVRVICAPPYYPWWKVQKPYRSWWPRRERLEGMNVQRMPLYVPRKPNGLRRLIHLSSIALSSLLPVLTARRADVVWIAQPSLALAPAALLAAHRMNANVWMHVQDLEVSAAERLGVLPTVVTDAITTMESSIYGHCAAISTISSAMRTQLEMRCLHEIPLFPNWVDLEQIQPIKGPSPYRSELGIPDNTMVVLYSGNMGEKQGLDIVVQAAHLLKDEPGLLFLLAGQGAVRTRLEEQARGLGNVRFLPLQPSERMGDFLALGDIHLVPQKAGVGNLVMPSKMTGILSAAKPVIAACEADDELASIAKECGMAVLPGDARALADAILQMAESPEARRALGMAGRIFAQKNLSNQVILPNMEDFLQEVAALRCVPT